MEKEDEILEEKEIKTEETQEEQKEEENASAEETKQEEIEEKTEKKVVEAGEEKTENVKHQEKAKKVDETETKKENRKVWIVLPIVLIVLLFLSTIFAILNINNTNVVNGVFIEDIEVSNLSKEQLSKIVQDKINFIENIEIYYGEYSEAVKLEDLGIKVNASQSINQAISIGKSNNIVIDNFNILKSMLFKTKIDLDITIKEKEFKEMAKNTKEHSR